MRPRPEAPEGAEERQRTARMLGDLIGEASTKVVEVDRRRNRLILPSVRLAGNGAGSARKSS